ncbi:hypothetical protein BDQ17DRAFT_1359781 [Cyathus striatus]|nr:hypothetical protein BDQ17DRAFT_1359781 [Cyathus striatus]
MLWTSCGSIFDQKAKLWSITCSHRRHKEDKELGHISLLLLPATIDIRAFQKDSLR